ncbi:MAG TPA: sigma-54 dependent transcriptional regulator [Gemmatimonadaceae bacterium]|nr:sigma-54 dependent transcriptional regulator [Gemmatimonadaceae bacterium]
MDDFHGPAYLRQIRSMEMPGLSVLVVDDEPALREVLSLRIADWGHDARTVADAAEAEREIDRRRPDLVLCDLVLPGSSGMELLKRIKRTDDRLPVVMMTAHGNVDGAVEAMKLGATDFLTKPLDYVALYALLEVTADDARRRLKSRSLDARLDTQSGTAGLIGQSRAMRALHRTIDSLASSDASAILTGESGTGKEVAARAIHASSARRDKPFVAINAAAIPEGLVESEVFGHEQGAFTGATRSRAGVFELANGGTLFLDEIAEMPIGLQPKLLRVLEDSRARRLGGSRDVQFDVRVLAATNRPPAQAIRDGRLREDLYYRLNVFELTLPPLRERAEDIALLAQHFVRELGRKHHVEVEGVGDAARELLEAHAWPGNVRELRNVIERSTIVARAGWIEPRHLPPYLQSLHHGGSPTLTLPAGTTLAEAEKLLILQTLDRVGHNKAEAARQLGLDVKTIRNKLRSYGYSG